MGGVCLLCLWCWGGCVVVRVSAAAAAAFFMLLLLLLSLSLRLLQLLLLLWVLPLLCAALSDYDKTELSWKDMEGTCDSVANLAC